jgi:hypothetical protein
MAEVFRWDFSSWDDGGVWGPADGQIAYSLRVDLDRDGTYAPANPLAEIGAGYTVHVDLEYGLPQAFDAAGHPASFGAPARMVVSLLNRDDAFLPEAVDALFYGLIQIGQLVRLQATGGSGVSTLFVGRLEELRVNPSRNAAQVATLLVTDITERLLDAEYRPPLLTNVRTDEAIAPIFERALVPWPYAADFWVLNVSQLGVNTKLYQDTLMQFDAGRTTLAYAGDNLDNGQGVSAQGMIRDVVAAEAGGRFFYDAALGKYVFHSRAHDTLYAGTIHALTTDDFLSDAAYLWGDNLINALTVLYQKRAASDSVGILWRYSEAHVLLPIGGSRTFTIRFTDPDNPGAQVSALSVITPVPGTDFLAWDNSDYTDDRTARVGVSLQSYGNGATLTLVNSDEDDDIYITGLQVRGLALTAFTLDSVFHIDPESMATYERREPPPLDLRVVDDEEFAAQVARFIVNRYKTPVARFPELPFYANASAAMIAHALERRIGDQISVTGARLGHEMHYVIVGQRHTIDGASVTHRVSWIVAPLTQTQYWALDNPAYSLLGESTRLFL